MFYKKLFSYLIPALFISACSGHDLPDYTILSDETLAPFKRTVEVKLDGRVSEEELTAIAKKLKSLDRKSYDRTFISYEIEGEPTNDIGMSYAISHYDPDLEIQFLGVSREEQVVLWENIEKLETESLTGKVLGRWYNYGRPGSVYVVEQNDEGFIFHHVYPKVTTKEDNWGPISETFRAEWDGDAMKFFDPCCDGEWYKRLPNGEMRFQSDHGSDRMMPKAIRPENP